MRLYKLTILSSFLMKALEDTHDRPIASREFCQRIMDGTIFEFLSEHFNLIVGLSALMPADKLELLMEWEDMALAFPPGEMGLRRNGLLLLLRYLMEGIQRRSANPRHRLTDEPIIKEHPPSNWLSAPCSLPERSRGRAQSHRPALPWLTFRILRPARCVDRLDGQLGIRSPARPSPVVT